MQVLELNGVLNKLLLLPVAAALLSKRKVIVTSGIRKEDLGKENICSFESCAAPESVLMVGKCIAALFYFSFFLVTSIVPWLIFLATCLCAQVARSGRWEL